MLIKQKTLVLSSAIAIATLWAPTLVTAQAVTEPTSFLKRTFIFPDQPEMEVAAELSAVPLWTVVSNGSNFQAAPRTWCNAWVPAKGISDWDYDDCVRSITEVSAAVYDLQLPADEAQWYRFWETRPSNFVYVVPSFAADQAEMLARVEVAGTDEEIVNDPVALASLFRSELDQLHADVSQLQTDVGTIASSLADVVGVRDTVLDLATTVGGIRRDTTNRLSGVEAAQVAQGNTLKELTQAIDTIKDAQANQANTLTTQGKRLDDQGARLGTVEITQAAQGVALQQQREILNGVVQQRELTMRWYDESWVVYTALALVAAVSLIGFALLQLSKASKKELRVEKGKAESATRTAGEAKAQAESAEKVAGEAKAQIGPMKDRIDQVEDDFHFLMELDSQERFDNPSLTAALVESLQLTTEPLKLRVKCLDGRNRYVHVFADVDEEGAPGMRFKGLKKGYDFVHKQNLIALRRHLKKAVLQDWVIGIQAARKVLEDA